MASSSQAVCHDRVSVKEGIGFTIGFLNSLKEG
ncbi:hypothetical protein A2U01_0105448, partial [Trifolium medium]|nr:hypothetical protein [Trifolium medium]